MSDELDIKKVREICGGWDEESGCSEDYSDSCPFATDCKEAADKGRGDEDKDEEEEAKPDA